MTVTVAIEDSLLDFEQALEETMEAMEATAIDSGVYAVALAVTRKFGHSSAKASQAIVNTNNWVRVATSSRVAVATVAVMEAYISMP
jgi:hypothetical protein